MAIKDPTAWANDLAWYMTEDEVEDQVSAIESTLGQGGSKVWAALWIALVGILGGAFGGLTISPGIRTPVNFIAFLAISGVLLRGLHPLTVRLLSSGVAWQAMFAFVWTSMLGVAVLLSARIETRWLAYSLSVGGGAFIGMMYGSFPPGDTRNQDAWMMAFPLAPLGTAAATYLLRHSGAADTIAGAAAGGALAAAILMVPMCALLIKLWDEAQGLVEIGQFYLHNATFAPKAVEYLDRAIAIRPDNARYYTLRGVGLAQMNETGRASADWDKASALAPGDPEPHVHRGLDALRRGAVADAIRALESALEKNPDHARAHSHLGEAWERQQDFARAFEHYDRAVSAAPDDAKVRCNRSYAYLRRSDYEKALEDATHATRLESRFGLGYAARGQALLMLGHADDALESFREALDLGVEPVVHEDVLRQMESLEPRDDEEDD